MPVKRTHNLEYVKAATDPCKHELKGFHPDLWLTIPQNVALVNDNKDIGLFERVAEQPYAVYGHYFFHSRGREALNAAKDMLQEIFTGPYDVESIIGLTPLDKRGALWMNRQLGFSHEEDVETDAGPCRFVLLTKQEWEDRQHG